MVKRKSYRNLEKYIIEYKMRTPYPIPTPMNHSKYIKQNTRSTQSHPAHERSHAKLDSKPVLPSSEQPIKKTKRTKKPVQEQNQIQTPTNEQKTVPTLATTTNRSSCCTIL